MKRFPRRQLKFVNRLLVLLLPMFVAPLVVQGELDIVGQWEHSHYLYRGSRLPKRDPNSRMQLNYEASGSGSSYWYLAESDQYCEKAFSYHVEGNSVHEIVLSVSDQNSIDCVNHPEMQVGAELVYKIGREQNELYLDVPLGDESLVYVFESLDVCTE
jgi:hypothetical protein